MRPSAALELYRDDIRRIVLENRSTNPRVFGSTLRGDDDESSDLDLLIDPAPDTSLMDLASIQDDLQQLLGVPVDVLTPMSLPESFRSRIISEARPV
jgi:predicted nucleotidyltransferase